MEKIAINTLGTINRIRTRFNKNYFEQAYWQDNKLICGIDEVGRGCLAGPVVTAAVILPNGKTHRLLKDSKLMTPEERLQAFAWIQKHCWYSIGIVHHRMIDENNIWHATLIAMKKALVNLLAYAPEPAHIITDAMPLNLLDTAYKNIPLSYFPFGEKRSSSIAAASIVAKVKRDAMMQRLAVIFPGYDLGTHKGYSTPGHKRILKEKDQKLIIHRESFIKRLEQAQEAGLEGQQQLFDLLEEVNVPE